MACAAGREVRFQGHHDKRRHHGNQPRERPVALVENVWEAWVGQGGKGGREEVDKGRGHQDAGAEVLAEEEDVSSALATLRQVLGENGESTGCWASQLA